MSYVITKNVSAKIIHCAFLSTHNTFTSCGDLLLLYTWCDLKK